MAESEGNELPDVLGMSDEDFLAQDFDEVDVNVEETSNEQSEEAEGETSEAEATSSETEGVEEGSEDEAELGESEETSEGTSDANEDSTSEESDDEGSDTDEGTGGDKVENKEESIDDYQKQIDELFAPIRANGKDVKVKDINEARKLISMGIGFTKKMESLKPARLLQQKMKEHGLLDEGKLDFLIALENKDPEAIAQLLKDANLDPLKIDMESDSSYQPKAYSGGEDRIALDDVLTELEGSEHADDIADLIANKWGESSRDTLRDSPALLTIINGHMDLGIYDSIMERVEKEKMLGSYMGVSDIVAYGQVAEQMNSEGQFAHLNAPAQEQREPQTPKIIRKAITPKQKVDPNLKKKQATAVTKSSSSPKKPQKNYLSMSDDDFLAELGNS